MKITVCTGWSPAGWLEYGRRFAETFDQYWPSDVELVVYGEEPVKLPRGEFRELRSIEGCAEFLERHDNPIGRGRAPREDLRARWKPRELAAGYSYRFDAWKFCRQGFIPEAALRELMLAADPQLLLWLDADVYTHRHIPQAFLEELLPEDRELAYLGRGEKHSEIGFQLYRVDASDRADRVGFMLSAFREIYASDEVFDLPEWHSAYVFDTARKRTGILGHDLTPGGRGHVWHQSPLRMYTDHLKGDRKKAGRSHERKN
jgi:hypothetical protein